jgi:hypothetical protein
MSRRKRSDVVNTMTRRKRSDAVNTMTRRKRSNNDLQNTTHKTKD